MTLFGLIGIWSEKSREMNNGRIKIKISIELPLDKRLAVMRWVVSFMCLNHGRRFIITKRVEIE